MGRIVTFGGSGGSSTTSPQRRTFWRNGGTERAIKWIYLRSAVGDLSKGGVKPWRRKEKRVDRAPLDGRGGGCRFHLYRGYERGSIASHSRADVQTADAVGRKSKSWRGKLKILNRRKAKSWSKRGRIEEERQKRWNVEQQAMLLSFMERMNTSNAENRALKPKLPKYFAKVERGRRYWELPLYACKGGNTARLAKGPVHSSVSWSSDGKGLGSFCKCTEKGCRELRNNEIGNPTYVCDVNTEMYRLQFSNDRKNGNDSYRELADRSRDLYTRWRESDTMDLEEMMLTEQFVQMVPDDLCVWLKERKPESHRKAAELTDEFVPARRAKNKANSIKKALWGGAKGTEARTHYWKFSSQVRSASYFSWHRGKNIQK